jgi:hypothetical protein
MVKKSYLIFTPSHKLEAILTFSTTPTKCTISIQCDRINEYQSFKHVSQKTIKRRESEEGDDQLLECRTLQELLHIVRKEANLNYLQVLNCGRKGDDWQDQLGSGYCKELLV